MTSSAELRPMEVSRDRLDPSRMSDANGCNAGLADQIRGEVKRILGSAEFRASDRNRRFLEYVIEEKLAGRAERIKAYTIATTVFGRDERFDPQLDPIVRMEARRLRLSLERFYLTEGKHDPITISLPKGGYVPEFRQAAVGAGEEPENRSGRACRPGDGLSILVRQFEVDSDQPGFPTYESGLTRQLIIGLCRYPHLRVFGATSGPSTRVDTAENALLAGNDVDFILTGSKSISAGLMQVKAILLEARTGRVVWGQDFERELQPRGVLGVRDEVANLIVRILAQPYGVLFNHAAQSQGATLPGWRFMFHQYRRSYSRRMFQPTREALERAVARDPDRAEVLACLSLLCTDAHRFGFAAGASSRLEKQAAALAQRAIDASPDCSCGHHALGWARWFQHDIDASLRATETALGLNKNRAEVAADFGLQWLLLGERARSIPLLEKASAMNPAHVMAHHVGLSLDHFLAGRFEEALHAARLVDAPDVAHSHAVRAISMTRLGQLREASEEVQCILALDPGYGETILRDLGGENLHPELADEIAEALGEAGLPKAA